jgi:hypothetical protein
MAVVDFTPADMQILLRAVERASLTLNLTGSEADMVIKAQITSLIVACAEGGERDVKKLIDCALLRFRN